ncbi:ubiquitin carboxyl-terminal hydrolase [Indivirus ILV1]|uniref:Ubiquitin carboxyl-terminal hydrolase n=1 Tax=Indivirus ILV1 TaxID=1977633 RepID=A0A1V0SDI1_9VIRU|nr:ubiquitin carboxyl-terminal hydrolase [Indivirus ILV1]
MNHLKKSESAEEKVERIKVTVRGLSGLENLGNTCYMNSIIQCLTSLDYLRSWLLKDKYSKQLYSNKVDQVADIKRKENGISSDKQITIKKADVEDAMNNSIVKKLSELMQKMWYRNYSIRPSGLKKIIGEKCPIFAGYKQNDSQELLSLVLDSIHEETKVSVKVIFPTISEGVENYMQVKKECTEKINDESLLPEEREKYLSYLKQFKKMHTNDAIISDSYIFWRKYIQKSHSIITDLFTGLFYSKITCKECNNITWAFDPFTILSLPTQEQGTVTLEESFKKFVSPELLENQEKYFCAECKKKVDAIKKIHIWEPPNIMIIQLKRFKVTEVRPGYGMTSKTYSTVKFPIENLNISEYLSDIHPVNKPIYDLWAVSDHNGSCNSGHYIAYCKNSINGLWYGFNDERVFHVPNENLENEIITKDAYILFYVRRL